MMGATLVRAMSAFKRKITQVYDYTATIRVVDLPPCKNPSGGSATLTELALNGHCRGWTLSRKAMCLGS